MNRLIAKAKWLFGVVVAASRSYDAPDDNKLYQKLRTIVSEHRQLKKGDKERLYEEAYNRVALSDRERLVRIDSYKARIPKGIVTQGGYFGYDERGNWEIAAPTYYRNRCYIQH